jgi:phosphate-selective porin OprO/OprP
MDYRSFNDNASGDSGYQDKLDIRRARFGFEGKFMKDFDYKIFANFGAPATQGGMSSTDTELDEGYVGYKYSNGLKFRAGKFKMPFSLEQLTSSNNIDFMERSLGGQIEGELIPAKQVGAMVFGDVVDGATYAMALSQGSTSARKTSAYSSPDFVGRLTANFSKLLDRKDEVSHVGLAYSSGEIAAIGSGSIEGARTEAREANKFFDSTAVADAGATRIRTGIEAAYASGPFKIQAENMKVKYDNVTSADVSYQARYVQAVWNITGESHNYSNSSGAFGWIKPNSTFSNKGGSGAWQVGLRYSKFDASHITAASGRTNGADAMTYGLTWFANENMRFMLNYVVTNFDDAVTVANGGSGSAVTKQKAIMARAQVSF